QHPPPPEQRRYDEEDGVAEEPRYEGAADDGADGPEEVVRPVLAAAEELSEGRVAVHQRVVGAGMGDDGEGEEEGEGEEDEAEDLLLPLGGDEGAAFLAGAPAGALARLLPARAARAGAAQGTKREGGGDGAARDRGPPENTRTGRPAKAPPRFYASAGASAAAACVATCASAQVRSAASRTRRLSR